MFQQAAKSPLKSGTKQESPVKVYTEWDPLQEVIVGVIADARVPDWHVSLDAVIPDHAKDFFKRHQGKFFPAEQIELAQKEVDNFADVLASFGIKVRRPEPLAENRPMVTPFFSASGTFYSAMPRDCLLAIGDMILEVPMCWRNRYFETFAFRSLLKEYFAEGARWISAPKPELRDELFDINHDPEIKTFNNVLTEFEPVFDAADFMKMGRDIIGQLSHVTNWQGVDWLQRHLGDDYKIHIYEFDDSRPMHIDTTILPLAPGKVLVNKGWVSRLPDIFKDWEILEPPASVIPDSHPLYMTSKWISTNVLMLDDRHVVVEAGEEPLMKAFKQWGFEVVPVPFRHFQSFGGSFHCATLDVRRDGELKSYV